MLRSGRSATPSDSGTRCAAKHPARIRRRKYPPDRFHTPQTCRRNRQRHRLSVTGREVLADYAAAHAGSRRGLAQPRFRTGRNRSPHQTLAGQVRRLRLFA